MKKLLVTENDVQGMQKELEDLQPKLVVSAKETADLMQVSKPDSVRQKQSLSFSYVISHRGVHLIGWLDMCQRYKQ